MALDNKEVGIMTNLELKLRVCETGLDVVDINGFKYNLIKVDTKVVKGFKVLIPIFDQVEVDDVIKTEKYQVTRLGENAEPIDLVIRIDKFEIIGTGDKDISEYLNVRVKGMITGSEKCYLKTVGPDRKAFYMCTIKLLDEYRETFGILLVAFNNSAKKLSTIPFASSVTAEVSIRPKLKQPGYEMAVVKIDRLENGGNK